MPAEDLEPDRARFSSPCQGIAQLVHLGIDRCDRMAGADVINAADGQPAAAFCGETGDPVDRPGEIERKGDPSEGQHAVAGLATQPWRQVHMGVDDPRHHHEAAAIALLMGLPRDITHFGHLAATQGNIGNTVQPIGRINDQPAAQYDIVFGLHVNFSLAQSNIILGKKVTMLGTEISSSNTTKSQAMNGKTPR